jgi:predicted metal-dependent peptidase
VDEVRPSEIEILDIDTRIHQIRTFNSDEYPIDWMKLGIKGRGGTAFSPAFEHYENEMEKPQCLIYLTDLGSNDFGKEPEFPVLWVSTTNLSEVPFGEVTQIDVSYDQAQSA